MRGSRFYTSSEFFFPCKLCGARKPTPAHILSACPTALLQKRYTYRHDQVLAVLYNAVVRKVKEAASSKRVQRRVDTRSTSSSRPLAPRLGAGDGV